MVAFVSIHFNNVGKIQVAINWFSIEILEPV